MTNTLRMKLREALDNGEYYDFIELLAQNGLAVDECGIICNCDGRYEGSYYEDDDSLAEDLQSLSACDILWHAMDYLYTVMHKMNYRLDPVSDCDTNSVDAKPSYISTPSIDFVEL